MGWVPDEMWLTYARVDGTVDEVDFDLAISVDGDPSLVDMGRPGPFTWLLGSR